MKFQTLISLVSSLKTHPIKKTIDARMFEFQKFQKASSPEIFNELCFCLLTANFSAQGGIKIQNAIGDGFSQLSEKALAKKLAELGHRFPNMRAKFIYEARQHKDSIKETMNYHDDDLQRREWLVKNIKGLGMKESSHFLRNIGFSDVAIIDFHIVDILAEHELIDKPKNKSLSSKTYLEIENILRELAEKTQTSLGELDLYLWFNETGTVLK
ncbi:N-glycosylase/DNA lyase [Candidatus Pacearchaeota archaeon]|nr:N-glycosylase/DNA lyase [Candidatus Pacearchaeota archaeon]